MGLAFSAETSIIRNQEALKEPEKFTWAMTKKWFVDCGKQMYKTGKGFGKVGAIYTATECWIEGVSQRYISSNRLRMERWC
jgi:hypothetical protein